MSEPTCPKCGGDQGWSGPTYWVVHATFDWPIHSDGLRFACATCGYTRSEPTKDAPPPLPPRTPVLPYTDPGWWGMLKVVLGGGR